MNLLIVMNMQNDYFAGPMANENTKVVLNNAIDIINNHNGTIIGVHDTYFNPAFEHFKFKDNVLFDKTLKGAKYKEFCIKLGTGWETQKDILKALKSKNGNGQYKFHSIDKYDYEFNDWKKYLNNYEFDDIEIIGFYTNEDIALNAIKLKQIFNDKKIIIHKDACAGSTYDEHIKCLNILEKNGFLIK